MATLPSWWDRVDGIMRQAGVPTRVWTAIAYPESSFVPWAANTADPHGGSYGLFALNLGGQGHGYAINYLKDPINNAQIAAPHLASAVRKCGADNIQCIALWSGHPVETGTVALPNALVDNIKRYFGAGKDLTGPQIYDKFTSGQGIPEADPGESGSGGGFWGGFLEGITRGLTGGATGGSTPGSGTGGATGFWEGFLEGFGSGIGGTPAGGASADTGAAILMFGAGVGLIIVGVVIAAAKSPVGKVAASVAPAPVKLGARVAGAM